MFSDRGVCGCVAGTRSQWGGGGGGGKYLIH